MHSVLIIIISFNFSIIRPSLQYPVEPLCFELKACTARSRSFIISFRFQLNLFDSSKHGAFNIVCIYDFVGVVWCIQIAHDMDSPLHWYIYTNGNKFVEIDMAKMLFIRFNFSCNLCACVMSIYIVVTVFSLYKSLNCSGIYRCDAFRDVLAPVVYL